MDAFTTYAPAMAEETKDEIIARQTTEIDRLSSQLQTMTSNWEFAKNQLQESRQKIANVKGYLFDFYSENGHVDEDMKEIARLLDITLTKEISGTASFEISWTAQVPLDFDPDDFEISFDVNCEEYDAEDFDWTEEHTSVSAEEV